MKCRAESPPDAPHYPMPESLMTETQYSDYISKVSEIIDEARNGRMFILVDHEDRENEGD